MFRLAYRWWWSHVQFPSTVELESGGHEELEIHREACNAKISFIESYNTWAADITSTDVILEKGLPYKHSGNIFNNNDYTTIDQSNSFINNSLTNTARMNH